MLRIAKLCGLNVLSVDAPITGYRNKNYKLLLKNGSAINFILYKNEPKIPSKIKNANYVSNYLASRGFLARRPLDRRIVKLSWADQIRYGALYNFLPGQTIPWEAYTRKHLKLQGQTLGNMHFELRNLPQKNLPNVHQEYAVILERIQKYFASGGVGGAIRQKLGLEINFQKLEYLARVVAECGSLSNQQALHMDFVRSNILFMDEPLRISGILDFEKAAYGSPLFDVARTLAFLIVDCKYKTADEVHKSFLISGYIRSSKMPFNDIKIRRKNRSESLLNNLVDTFLLYDFYKFLRHNPYEFLEQNEHFARTRNILVEHKTLKMIK